MSTTETKPNISRMSAVSKRGLLSACIMVLAARGHAVEIAGFSPDQSLVYKTVGETRLKLHIFNPEGHQASDKRPVIVFFFGGGWIGGSPSQFYPHCEYLASRGMVAISAEYRTQHPHGVSPQECVKDGKSAVRWIRRHAAELGIDPDKVLAGGGSAGGHVAAATGTTTAFEEEGEDLSTSAVPAALVLFNPVFDNGPEGYGHDRVKEYWKAISPMHNISGTTPPTIVFLGTRDKHVPVKVAREYKRLMEVNGRRCDLHLFEGQAHGFFNYANREFYTKTIVEMDRFLGSLGYLEGEPTLRMPEPAGNGSAIEPDAEGLHSGEEAGAEKKD